jgi:hypothetical protein
MWRRHSQRVQDSGECVGSLRQLGQTMLNESKTDDQA